MITTTDKKHVAALAEIAFRNGIDEVIISPGSRNAPLVIAFESHPEINTRVVHDERVAAFVALGMAESSGKPVIITCTSGSAPLNYAPAIAEAYYRQIPLLILTADRPPSLIDQGDGQTIRQNGVYANYIKAQFQLYEEEVKFDENIQISYHALTELISAPTGPVHINIPFNEPLYNKSTYRIIETKKVKEETIHALNDKLGDSIKDDWGKANSVLFIIGQNTDKSLLNQLRPIIEQPGVACITESISNVHDHEHIVHCIDRTLAGIKDNEVCDFVPDLLISMGGAVISKRIKAFFRHHKPKMNWRIGEFLIQEDTYQSLSLRIPIKSREVLQFVASLESKNSSSFGNKWKGLDFQMEIRHNNFLAGQEEFSDLLVIEKILDYLPDDSNLHLGNSSVVRYCQLFTSIPRITYFSNRGVSGIDGCLSTAVGIAIADPNKANTIILGDISFMYDNNALWINDFPQNLNIIVINNGGGGIFKILPDANESVHHEKFFAPHQPPLAELAKAFGFNYLMANSIVSMENALVQTFSVKISANPCFIEVDTRLVESNEVLQKYFESLREQVA